MSSLRSVNEAKAPKPRSKAEKSKQLSNEDKYMQGKAQGRAEGT